MRRPGVNKRHVNKRHVNKRKYKMRLMTWRALSIGPTTGSFARTQRAATAARASTRDRIRESIMMLLTMGLNSDYFLYQPFKTRNHFDIDQISLSSSSPRRNTNAVVWRTPAPAATAFHPRRKRGETRIGGFRTIARKLRRVRGLYGQTM